jgi:AcrR family transcriptional regulator
VFFDSDDYLLADPAKVGSEREAERLRREAEQRAKLCEATTRLAARGGLEEAAIHLAARSAGVGQGTYYKLYDTKDACLREAFDRCADTVFGRVTDAAARSDETAGCIEAGLGELLDLLTGDPDVARLLLGGILAGDLSCRAARERTLERFASLLATGGDRENPPARGSLAWLAAAAITSTLGVWLDRDDAPPTEQMLDELVRVASVQGRAREGRPPGADRDPDGGGERRDALQRGAGEVRGTDRRSGRRSRNRHRERRTAASGGNGDGHYRTGGGRVSGRAARNAPARLGRG